MIVRQRAQYHNRHFKAAAEELGLEVIQVRNYGFALTALPKRTAKRYREEIRGLREVLVHRRKPLPVSAGPGPPTTDDNDPKPRSRLRKAVCSCRPPWIIRVAKATIDRTVIRCESCGNAFRLV